MKNKLTRAIRKVYKELNDRCNLICIAAVTIAVLCVAGNVLLSISKDEETGNLIIKHNIFSDYTFEVYDDHVTLLFYSKNPKTVKIPDTIMGKPVTEIGPACFSCFSPDNYKNLVPELNRRKIEEVYLGKNIKKIDEYAFMGCDSLWVVHGDNTVEIIGSCAFSECSLMEFEPKMERIEDEAFYYNYVLDTINTDSDITYIGCKAFYKCAFLTDIGEQPNLGYVGDQAFSYTWLETFKASDDAHFGYGVFTGTPYLRSFDELLLDGIQMKYTYDGSKPYIIYSTDVTYIDTENVYGDLTGLEEVYIPDTVKEINGCILHDKQKVVFYIPDSVTDIEVSPAYSGEKAYGIASEASKIVTTEGSYAQQYARKYDIPCEIVDEIVMPE